MAILMRHPETGLEQRLAVADLLDDGVDAILRMAPSRVRIVYSDPPWNPGNEKYWRRHAGAGPPADYDNLLRRWISVAVLLGAEHVLCEQSANDKHAGMLMRALERHPGWRLALAGEWTVYYGTPGSRGCSRPNRLLHFAATPAARLTTDPSGLRGVPMTRKVFEGFPIAPPGWVADPCIGKGMTSRLGHEFGWNVIGTELNPKRLEKTIAWLRKKGYEEVAEW